MTTRQALDAIAAAAPRWRQWFGTVLAYAGFLALWAVAAATDGGTVPDFSWSWLWWPFQVGGWVLGAAFVAASLTWGALTAWAAIHAAGRRARAVWAAFKAPTLTPDDDDDDDGDDLDEPDPEPTPQDAPPEQMYERELPTLLNPCTRGIVADLGHATTAQIFDRLSEDGHLDQLPLAQRPQNPQQLGIMLTKMGWPARAKERHPAYPDGPVSLRYAEDWPAVAESYPLRPVPTVPAP